MRRTSSYTIYVDLPDDPEDMLLIHGYTGAYDRVSRRVATYLRQHEEVRAPRPLFGQWREQPPVADQAVEPSPETLAALRRRGYLTHLSVDEERDLFRRVVSKVHAARLATPPGYVLMPTYDCNLRCPYCFQDELRADGASRRQLRVMDRSVADRIFAAMPRIEADHGFDGETRRVERRNVTLFGGEPLLASSRPIIEYVLHKLHEMGEAEISAVTNATELDAYEDLLGPGGIANLQITLDGPSEEHDRRRVYPDGQGSFDRIADHVSLALERGARVRVRMNIDRNNVQQLPALAHQIQEHGWHRDDNFMAYVSPIRAENESTDAATTLSMWELHQHLVRLRQEDDAVDVISDSDESTVRQAQRVFSGEGDSYSMLRSSYCGAHTTMYVFDAFGDVYTCWERTAAPQDAELCLGRLAADGSLDARETAVRTWRTRTVAANPVCSQCRYALFCGGGCAVGALGRSGTYFRNFCDGFRERFRASIAAAYQQYLSGDEAPAEAVATCEI
jgi:uncharacterized protein